MGSYWIKVDLKSDMNILIWARKGQTESQGRSHVRTEAEFCCHRLGNHQRLEEMRKAPSLEPADGLWPCPSLDFELLDSQISVVISQYRDFQMLEWKCCFCLHWNLRSFLWMPQGNWTFSVHEPVEGLRCACMEKAGCGTCSRIQLELGMKIYLLYIC